MSARTAVVVCIIVIVGMFGLSCFLMTTVNPEPIINEVPSPSKQPQRRHGGIDGLPSDPWESLTPFYRFKAGSLAAILNNTTSVEEEDDPIFNFPLNVRREVIPPLYPVSFTPIKRTTPSTLATSLNALEQIENELSKSKITDAEQIARPNYSSSSASEKVHRRSVNNFFDKAFDDNSSIIMQIINKYNQPKIEIKINTGFSSKINNDSFDDGSKLEMTVQKNGARRERGELGRNTEIKVLSNDTVTIDRINEHILKSVTVTAPKNNEQKSRNTNEPTNVNTNYSEIKILLYNTNADKAADVFNNEIEVTNDTLNQKL